MFRIPPASSSTEAADYYVHLADADNAVGYYVDGQEMPGHWRGGAAARLGLNGGVKREEFQQLCQNINPATGERLTARNRANRRVGWDMNFHCPKTVSVVRELTGDTRIDQAFQMSVQEAMEELEKDCECRVRDNGQNGSRVTGNMVWGEFIHKTARPVDGIPDPHLHAHCFVFNATWDEEQQKWKAADIANIKRDGSYFEAAFYTRFAARLLDLGYGIERTSEKGWEIASVPESVIDKFSNRKKQVEQLAEELGITDAAQKDKLGATSRKRKDHKLSMDDLRQEWDSRLTDEERDAIMNACNGGGASWISVEDALDHSVWKSFERRSAVSERALVGDALRRGVGVVSVEDMWAHTKGQQDKGAIVTGVIDGRRMVSTKEVLEVYASLRI